MQLFMVLLHLYLMNPPLLHVEAFAVTGASQGNTYQYFLKKKKKNQCYLSTSILKRHPLSS